MKSFRRKINYSLSITLIGFALLLFPLLWWMTSQILKRVYIHRVESLVIQAQEAPNETEMLQVLHNPVDVRFETAGLFDSSGALIDEFPKQAEISNKEIVAAIKQGVGYSDKGDFLYIAKSFTARGQKYILYVTFPAKEIHEVMKAFLIPTYFVLISLLLINNLLLTLIVNYILRPVQQIVNAIRMYKEGKEELLPRIALNPAEQPGELNRLAWTFNSLIDRVQRQIEYLTRQREETEEILESIGEGVIAADPSARVTFVNGTACRMLGISREMILNQTLDAIPSASEGLRKKCHELLIHALHTSESNIQTWIEKEESQYLDLISAPLAHREGALLVFQDKTSDYRIVDLGKDFIANASHELRTPITIIRGFAETLQDLPDISKEMLNEILGKIVRTCIRLDKLVRSLLTLTDAENLSGDRFKTVDLIPMIENCVHTLMSVNPQAQVDLNLELESALMTADPDLIELAIMNILENAVKYSEPPARVEVSVKKVDQQVHLQIKDHGIGISERDLPHVFERFYTVDKARSRKAGGAGLGLAIVKTIIEKHKGKILLSSELGKGSTFILLLPLDRKILPQ